MPIVPLHSTRFDSSKLLTNRDPERASTLLEDLELDCLESPAGSGCSSEGKEFEKNDKRDFIPPHASARHNSTRCSPSLTDMPEGVEDRCQNLAGFESSLL